MAAVRFDQALVERRHNLAQQFAEGWIFGQVINYEDAPMTFEQYAQLAAGSGQATIGAVTDYWFEWMNTQQQRVFRERDTDKVLQAFIGIYPSRLRLFKQFPAPVTRGELYEIKVPAVLTAQAGGYISGEWSPFEAPSSLTEMIIPPEMIIKWGVFNPESIAVYPRFQIYIRRVQMRYFKPNNAQDKKSIEAIMDGKMPCKLWSPGIQPYEYDTMDRIGVEVTKWTPGVLMGLKGNTKQDKEKDEEVEA